jgi:hypothetical protein
MKKKITILEGDEQPTECPNCKEKYGYQTPEDCFEDRVNHRVEWYDLICEFNFFDKTALAREIVKDVDCYVGMRDRDEIEACIKHNIFDLIIWVDACERLPLEPKDSFNIDKSCADIIIDNNYDLDSLYKKVIRLGKIMFKK